MEDQTSTPEPSPTQAPTPPRDHSPLARLQEIKLPLWAGLALLVLVLLVFAWKSFAVAAVERNLANERQAVAEERAAIQNETAEALLRASDADHALFGTALAWAVRGEMIRNNLDQIDQYFNELVRAGRIQLVVLANQDGKILVSSDRALIDAPLPASLPAELLQVPDVTVQPAANADERRIAIPIQGLNTRLGTVLLTYRHNG
ncbi:hypothetical protein E6C76_08130 [Pseudothauera nasutitermitis]|uniref:Uncharacterized protein n=1 Tax=Pseudothauera nasutitermitis TaxID=2565930 RepID=A0A4S4AZE4_9RHOO|nr:hypothetical protein [Pseudothauera nasutitermitis]THF65539.1 hypothetical protein E6C76_08130 [Pseudothauera nasutitermitis]